MDEWRGSRRSKPTRTIHAVRVEAPGDQVHSAYLANCRARRVPGLLARRMTDTCTGIEDDQPNRAYSRTVFS